MPEYMGTVLLLGRRGVGPALTASPPPLRADCLLQEAFTLLDFKPSSLRMGNAKDLESAGGCMELVGGTPSPTGVRNQRKGGDMVEVRELAYSRTLCHCVRFKSSTLPAVLTSIPISTILPV